MQQPIQDSGDNNRVMEQFSPVREGFVGGNDGARLFIAGSDEVVEQVAFFPTNRRIPDFIYDYQSRFEVTPSAA